MPKKAQKKQSKHSAIYTHLHLVLALGVGMIAAPTVTALMRSTDDTGLYFEDVQDQQQRAATHKTSRRQTERNYWDAMDVYRELIEYGIEDLIVPDINNPSSLEIYLDEEYVETLVSGHRSPDPDPDPSDESALAEEALEALPEWERDLLQGYKRTGYCPETLKHYHLPGFFQLCEALVEDSDHSTKQPFRYERARLRGFVPGRTGENQTLKRRLEIIEEAIQNQEEPQRSRRRR